MAGMTRLMQQISQLAGNLIVATDQFATVDACRTLVSQRGNQGFEGLGMFCGQHALQGKAAHTQTGS